MAFEAIREQLRQELTGDVKFLGRDQNDNPLVYYFELDLPTEVGGRPDSNFIFPLVLNPEEISMEEPFSVTATPTARGGLWVEEDGIIQRMLRIKGHTGFKPRAFRGSQFLTLNNKNPSFSRTNALAGPIDAISGHRHFQYLQDTVFRLYADLKRDPATAADTKMSFHNMKDDEHWLVVPQKFTLNRNAGGRGRVLYEYNIELLVVGPAAEGDFEISEDKNLLDTIKDGLRMIQSGIDLVNSTVRDIGNVIGEIERLVTGFGAVVNGAVDLVNVAANVVNGTASLIASPFNTAANLANSLDTALDNIVTSATAFPDTITNSVRNMQEGVFRLMGQKDKYLESTNEALYKAKRNEEITTRASPGLLAAVAQEESPNSFQAFIAKGTGLLPGAELKARSELGIGRVLDEYQSAIEETIHKGDTVQNLAQRFLGDARKYRHLIVLNRLKYPYISENGEPGTLKIGDKILIPSQQPSPDQQTLLPVYGVGPDKSLQERLLGTDLALDRVSGPGDLYDIPIDVAGGSVDVKIRAGIPNLEQAMITRTRTERGTNVLYRTLGRRRVIGTKIPSVDQDMARFRIAESISADPRIARVRQVRINEAASPDILDAEITAEVRGFTTQMPFALQGVG